MKFKFIKQLNKYILIVFVLVNTILIAQNCECCIIEDFFNETIVSQYITLLDYDLSHSQPILYKYSINSDLCDDEISLYFNFKLISPIIGINTFETYYEGTINLDGNSKFFTNKSIKSTLMPISNNEKLETLINYVSKSGKLPNGKFLFNFKLISDSDHYSLTKIIEYDSPLTLELLSPGGDIKDLSSSYTFSTMPIFNWYSDYCYKCEFSIRISEFIPKYHDSVEDALFSNSIIPYDQTIDYFPIEWNTGSFKFPITENLPLTLGNYYVWQIRRTFDSTFDKNFEYSPIYIFEVRKPDKIQLDFSDPYLTVIKSLIGDKQFNLLFKPGGELDQYTISGDIIFLDNQEVHIEGLYSILSELNNKNIIIEQVLIK